MLELRIKYIKKLDQKLIRQSDVVSALGVSRQTVSKWLAKYRMEGEAGLMPRKSGPKKGYAWNRTAEAKEDMVCGLARDNPFKPPEWIADQMPFSMHPVTVYRILRRRKVRYHREDRRNRRKKQLYCLDRPGRELQLDVCFPFGYARREVVYDAIDDCSRFVFARVMRDQSAQSSLDFLILLLKECPFKVEAVRTDQGSEFSKEITMFLQGKGIEHRRNAPYTPQHNGKIERYHRTFKENEACHWPFRAPQEELNYYIRQWLSYYNYRKKHNGLGMNQMTPVQKIAYSMIQNSYDKNVNLMLQYNKTWSFSPFVV